MKIVATLMVRDEADIVSAMVEHTLAQGVDLIIATDNGSIDGTTEILQAYADLGVVELHHDPVHKKQQHAVVTQMARSARTSHGADWVLNLDADEFCVPVDKSMPLRVALENTPLALNAFTAPVVNLVGPPALSGPGVGRLVWRDVRSQEQLQRVGIHAQPTPNAIHRGEADVTVAQGNHFVSINSNGQPAPEYAIEVLHLPWRSWAQLERKVVNAGRAYAASPNLRPSKNHHGMADYRRYLAGRLEYAYHSRSPLPDDLTDSPEDPYVYDPWLSNYLDGLRDRALCPRLLGQVLDSEELLVSSAEHVASARVGRQFLELERERDNAIRALDKQRTRNDRLTHALRQAKSERTQPQRHTDDKRADGSTVAADPPMSARLDALKASSRKLRDRLSGLPLSTDSNGLRRPDRTAMPRRRGSSAAG